MCVNSHSSNCKENQKFVKVRFSSDFYFFLFFKKFFKRIFNIVFSLFSFASQFELLPCNRIGQRCGQSDLSGYKDFIQGQRAGFSLQCYSSLFFCWVCSCSWENKCGNWIVSAETKSTGGKCSCSWENKCGNWPLCCRSLLALRSQPKFGWVCMRPLSV